MNDQKNTVDSFGYKSCWSGVWALRRMVDMNSTCVTCCKTFLLILERNKPSIFKDIAVYLFILNSIKYISEKWDNTYIFYTWVRYIQRIFLLCIPIPLLLWDLLCFQDVSLYFNIHLKKIKGHLSENLGNGKTVEISNTI